MNIFPSQKKKKKKKSQHQQQQRLQSLQTTFCPAMSADGDLGSQGRVALARPLDPVSDLGGQQGRAVTQKKKKKSWIGTFCA